MANTLELEWKERAVASMRKVNADGKQKGVSLARLSRTLHCKRRSSKLVVELEFGFDWDYYPGKPRLYFLKDKPVPELDGSPVSYTKSQYDELVLFSRRLQSILAHMARGIPPTIAE